MRYCPVFMLVLVMLWTPVPSRAGEPASLKPGATEKCPVCGMFVAKYPDFVARIVFRDGSHVFFDGVKDMMKFIFDVAKYSPSKTASDIDLIQVTDYYTVEPIDGKTACYLTGCDVYGPMGRELIPVEKEAGAREFMEDHKCKAILKYGDITRQVVTDLE